MKSVERVTNAPTLVSCAGGCKDAVTEPEKVGWDYLPISQRWRCAQCTRDLLKVGNLGHMIVERPEVSE